MAMEIVMEIATTTTIWNIAMGYQNHACKHSVEQEEEKATAIHGFDS